MTDLEASLVAGMRLWFDRAADAWHYNTTPPASSPLAQAEAEVAAAYLRGRAPGPDGERRSWFRRQTRPELLAWRKAPVWRDLNGPTAEPWGRWFSTADGGVPRGEPDLPSVLRTAAQMTCQRPASVGARWDWAAYTLHGRLQLDPPPSDLRGPEGGPNAPWPVWADERTAWRRLVQRAAELLFEANANAWQTNKARRRVNVPGGDEWPVIAALLQYASADTQLYFGDEPQEGWGALSSTDGLGSTGTAITLWRVFHGWSHLRKCAACGRWVVSGGQRARTLCDAACKQSRHRRTPGKTSA